jgi:hypothetical protein
MILFVRCSIFTENVLIGKIQAWQTGHEPGATIASSWTSCLGWNQCRSLDSYLRCVALEDWLSFLLALIVTRCLVTNCGRTLTVYSSWQESWHSIVVETSLVKQALPHVVHHGVVHGVGRRHVWQACSHSRTQVWTWRIQIGFLLQPIKANCQNPKLTNNSIELNLRLDYILTERSTTHHPTNSLLLLLTAPAS